MEELNINIPKGKVIDWKKSVKENKIILKDSNQPKSWEEFCRDYLIEEKEKFIYVDSDIYNIQHKRIRNPIKDKNVISSQYEAKAFIALMQLRQLRKAWVGNEKVNRCLPWVIVYNSRINKIESYAQYEINHPLSFPSCQMTEEFMKCFKNLLNKAKILL